MRQKCGFHFVQEGVYQSTSLQQEIPSYEYCMTGQEWLERVYTAPQW